MLGWSILYPEGLQGCSRQVKSTDEGSDLFGAPWGGENDFFLSGQSWCLSEIVCVINLRHNRYSAKSVYSPFLLNSIFFSVFKSSYKSSYKSSHIRFLFPAKGSNVYKVISRSLWDELFMGLDTFLSKSLVGNSGGWVWRLSTVSQLLSSTQRQVTLSWLDSFQVRLMRQLFAFQYLTHLMHMFYL